MTPGPDKGMIALTLSVLHPDEAVIELRALHKGRKRTDAGYFDHAHRAELVDVAARINQVAAVYVNLNPLDSQLLARCANRVKDFAESTATDTNVTRRRWLLVDLDPVRPKDTSATEAQLRAAVERGREVYRHLAGRGWPKPVVAESGNGLHLLYRIDLPNDSESRDLVKGCLDALADRFDTEAVKVDRSVYNAGRIVKLHGTIANKGDNIPSAPWRLSGLRDMPGAVEIVPVNELRTLAAENAATAKAREGPSRTGTGKAWGAADVERFLRRGGIDWLGSPESHEAKLRWKLKRCPFNPEHGATESAVFLGTDGALGFRCLHNSCAERHWRDLRELIDGPRSNARESRRDRGHWTDSGHLEPGRLILIPGNTVKMTPIGWLWRDWLAAGKFHLIAGAPGCGKTTIALAVAAILSRAGTWPDGTRAPLGTAVIWSGEDDPGDTLAPRLYAAEADMRRVHLVGGTVIGGERCPFDPARDMPMLDSALSAMSDVRVIVVDPVVSAITGDNHRNNEVRRGLQPLVDLAARRGAAVLGVTHLTKGSAGRDPLERVTGSLAYGALARLVWLAARQEPDGDTPERRVLMRAKSNIGPDGGGYEYALVHSDIPEISGLSASRVQWGAAIEGTARDVLAEIEPAGDTDDRRDRQEAAAWLRQLLAPEPMFQSDVKRRADESGFTWRTVQRAMREIGIVSKREGFGQKATWRLPESAVAPVGPVAPSNFVGATERIGATDAGEGL